MRLSVSRKFGAVVGDVMMPGESGIEIYLEIKNARPEMAERFVFMTGGRLRNRPRSFSRTSPWLVCERHSSSANFKLTSTGSLSKPDQVSIRPTLPSWRLKTTLIAPDSELVKT